MAFKFQLGEARLSGNVLQEGNLELFDDVTGNKIGQIKNGDVSGSGGLSGSNLVINNHGVVKQNGAITGYSSISGSGLISGADLSTLGTCDAVSGLGVDGTILLSDTKALQNVITISGAGVASAASVTINGNATLLQNGNVSAAAALIAATTVSGAGVASAASVTVNGNSTLLQNGNVSAAAALIAATTVSGAAAISGDNLVIGGSTATISAAGIISGSQLQSLGDLTVYGAAEIRGDVVNFPGVAAAAVDAADLFMALDSSTKDVIIRTRESIVADMAGSGLSAAAGVLSTQGSTVTLAATNSVLAEGYNYLAGISGVTMLSLPSGTIGDMIWVKAGSGVSSTNYIVISSSQKDAIDGSTLSGNLHIESPYGAVGFLYVGQSDWRIL